jgi:ferredoxin
MKINGKTVLLCDCEGTMSFDGAALTKACGGKGDLFVHNHLCRTQIDRFEAALHIGGPLIVACTQEAPLFSEVATGTAPDVALGFVNIRERAGWSEDAAAATAKIAALLVESAVDLKPSPTVSLTSNGECLIYGPGELAIPLAEQLADRLSVTLLVSDDEAVTPPTVNRVPMFRGSIIRAAGHLGAFTVTIANQASASASSRDRLDFGKGKPETELTCDLILDLTGEAPLFPGAEKRDGYARPDPSNPAALQKALFELTALVGEFEKPRYVAYDIDLCAHSRSTITGCSLCLDICPTSAIQSSGDGVVFDPFVCAGCGQCASVCPSGAVRYAMPSAEDSLHRLRELIMAYFKAGGERPALLLHDIRHGEPMIAMMARHGRGLPAPVLPFAFNEITQIGLDFLTAALAYGAARIFIMLPPGKRDERAGLDQQIAVADSLMAGLGLGEGRMTVIDEDDPAKIEALLYDADPRDSAARASFLPLGGKRTVMTLAFGELHGAAETPPEVVSLPAGAPFGRITVDTEGCTLCLACVGACPLSAIRGNSESPELSFTEQLCVQCGLCQKTCPENVISLEPRYNFASEARGAVVLNSEEPFECIRCGTPFGVKSAIERIVEQLAGKHSMFQGEAGGDVIKMCDNCRVNVQFEDGAFNQGTPRRPMRTTEDDLRERDERRARGEPDEDL